MSLEIKMFKYLATTTLLYTVLALAATPPDQEASKIPNYSKFPAHSGKIINGTLAKISEIPWQVALLRVTETEETSHCGGSIISSNWLVTAAHCLIYANKTERPFIDWVTAGSSIYWNGSLHRIIEKIPHPEFVHQEEYGSTLNDIAVIKIEGPFVFDETRQAVKLYDRNVETLENVMAIASGWGATLSNGWGFYDELKIVELSIATKTECDESLRLHYNGTMRPEGQLCAKNSGNGITYLGDSGGPLVVNETLVGVMSWSHGDFCAVPGNPVIFTKVSDYRDWILKETSD